MAERYGEELAEALPEADLVAGFGVPVSLGPKPVSTAGAVPSFDLLNLARPPASAPWAYVKVAEGCDRRCGFCAIPSFRGRQRSRRPEDILAEVDSLGVEEVVLVAQDLASYGRDISDDRRRMIEPLIRAVAERVSRVRLLYLYPSELDDGLIGVMAETGCAYFDLSLQHASRPLLRKMRRWGDGDRFLARVSQIRDEVGGAAFRSSFIVGYPGETEDDHDRLLGFLREAELDWAGFFPFSLEEDTYAAGLADQVPADLVAERLAEAAEIQDAITFRRRQQLVGSTLRVLVDEPGVARSHGEAPEIDGVVRVPATLREGSWADVVVTGAEGPDLDAEPVRPGVRCPGVR